jgi:acyl carrier protein
VSTTESALGVDPFERFVICTWEFRMVTLLPVAGLRETVATVVLDAVRLANCSRALNRQMPVGPQTQLHGEGSYLDSLELVTLAIDIEDGLRDKSVHIDLSDAHALSVRNSPFRTVETLIDYIVSRVADAG